MLEILDRKLTPIIKNYIDSEAERIVSSIVNTSVNELVGEDITRDLFNIKKNNNDEIQLITYNTKMVNSLLNKVNNNIHTKLLKLESGNIEELPLSLNLKTGHFKKIKDGVLYEITLESIRGSTLFGNVGPIIPVRMSFVGQINSNLKTKVNNYGINNLVIESYIVTEVVEQSTMPVSSKKQKITVEVPLIIEVIQGSIPSYYIGGFDNVSNNSSLQLDDK